MRLLLAEDDEAVRAVMAAEIEAAGHAVVPTTSARDTLALLGQGAWDALVTNAALPDGMGLDLIHAARARGIPGVLITGDYALIDSLEASGVPCFRKPFETEALLDYLSGPPAPGIA